MGDETYKSQSVKTSINKDALRLAASEPHNKLVTNTIDCLEARGVSEDKLVKLVIDLTSRNTYGTFCEISVYAFLLKGGYDFEVQVPVTGQDILNPNGANLDGKLMLSEQILFDAKAFGFQEHLVTSLVERLSTDLAPKFVAAEESWDVSVTYISDLLGKGYISLRDDLRLTGFARRDRLSFSLRRASNVQTVVRLLDPYLLAAENADYAFRYAKQFARKTPFILIFVIHPWVSGSPLHVNFQRFTDDFTRAFSRRTFMQFRRDSTPVFDTTRGQASQLLSGIIFIDAYEGEEGHASPRYRFFSNPHAKNAISDVSLDLLAQSYRSELSFENFRYDAY